MALDLSSFERAIGQLSAVLERSKAEPSDEVVRDAVIHRFEYVYEMSHKMIRRYLEAAEATGEDVRRLTLPSLVRLGWERGILAESWDRWDDYRKMRGTTGHACDADSAAAVHAEIPAFLSSASHLLAQLKSRERDL